MLQHSRWKALVVFTKLLIACVVSCVLAGSAPKRKQFIGKVAPETGLRCRFTVSADWQRTDGAANASVGRLEFVSFSHPNPSGKEKDSHVVQKPPSEPLAAVFTTYHTQDLSGIAGIRNGYPEPRSGADVLSHRHFRINGYPATVAEVEVQSVETRDTWRSRDLLVYVPKYSMLFEVQGPVEQHAEGAEEGEPSQEAIHEMNAIIASFHIEKVATSHKHGTAYSRNQSEAM